MLCNRIAESNVRCQEALEIARAVGAEAVEAHVLNTACATQSAVGDVDGAVGAAGQAGRIARRLGLTEQLIRSYINGGDALDQAGRVDEAIAMAREGIESARELGADRNWGNFLRAEIAGRLLQKGEWDHAERLLDEVIDTSPSGTIAGEAWMQLGHLFAMRGEFDDARAALDEAAGHVPRSVASQWLGPLAAARIELELWTGGAEAAAALVADTLARVGDGELLSYTARVYELGTRACAERAAGSLHAERVVSGQRAIAEQLLLRLDLLSERLGETLPPGVTARRAVAAAEISRLDGFGDERLWTDAQSRWDASGHLFDAAYARWRRADALLGTGGDRPAAQTLLQEARGIAVELRAQPLREGLEQLARRARIGLTTDQGPAPSAGPLLEQLELTPRELEVLALLSDGMTNREIATELFISDKTASVHVSRILAKLSVPNRTAAAAAAHQLGITRG
jgi:DNA-binding CsgD family transcriptional regulator